MQKIYCYADETGQDTKGKFFLVSVIVTEKDRDDLRNKLRKAEQVSGKKNRKWSKATRAQRKKYMEFIINDRDFINKLFYARYFDTKEYIDLTILATAKAILNKTNNNYEAIVFVDGLKKTERHCFAAGLRKLKVKIKKVRGLRDQSDEFIRLADALAGFIRDAIEKDQIMSLIYNTAKQNNIIKEL